jgi:hypothetical protein
VEAVEIQDRATTMARWFRFTLRMDSHLGRRASRKLMLAPIPERSVIPAEARMGMTSSIALTERAK